MITPSFIECHWALKAFRRGQFIPGIEQTVKTLATIGMPATAEVYNELLLVLSESGISRVPS